MFPAGCGQAEREKVVIGRSWKKSPLREPTSLTVLGSRVSAFEDMPADVLLRAGRGNSLSSSLVVPCALISFIQVEK